MANLTRSRQATAIQDQAKGGPGVLSEAKGKLRQAKAWAEQAKAVQTRLGKTKAGNGKPNQVRPS